MEKNSVVFFSLGGGIVTNAFFAFACCIATILCTRSSMLYRLFQVCSVIVHVLHDELCELDLVTLRTGFGYWL